ncbi:hypothetical protein GYMLUDRAFT_107937, partial [Collybiopsis luxurians FD-317 M1]
LKEWEPKIPRYLLELIQNEGLKNGLNSDGCLCGKVKWEENPLPIYQCVDCFDCNLCCQECLLHHHQSNPFHTVEHWNGRHFETATLYELGLVIHLGHSPLLPCIGHSNVQKFTVIDTDHIYLAAIRFCRCSHTILDCYQLLCAQLYPATLTTPQTAATFRFLKFFQMLSFMSKV